MRDPTLDSLAELFRYPDAAGRAAILEALASLGDPPELAAFVACVRASAPEALEERYTRTFDVNPVCSLEAGWHLFGEDYARGAFLVQVRARLRETGVEETTELPDHLVHLLRLLARLDGEDAATFARSFVLPAVGKMLEAFRDAADPYRAPLAAVDAHLRARHGAPEPIARAVDHVQPGPYAGCGGCPHVVPQGGSDA